MKTTLTILAAIAVFASSAAFAAGEKPKRAAQACTFEICQASAIKHGYSPSVGGDWCRRHLEIGDACKNVGK